MTCVMHRYGWPRRHEGQEPHGGSQLAMTRSPTARPATPSPTAITQPAVAGGEVGVAYAGGPDPDPHLSRPRADGLDIVTDVELGVLDRVEYSGPHDPPPVPRMRGDLCR